MQNIKIKQIEPVVRKRGNDLTFIIFDFLTKFKLKNICRILTRLFPDNDTIIKKKSIKTKK